MKTHTSKQQGATLIIALVFLLILTTLAVTNMREVALEARITGNLIDQKQLFNASEAGLRDGEHRTIGTLQEIPGAYDILTALTPLNAEESCDESLAAMQPCLIDRKPTYEQYFDGGNANFKGVQDYSPDPDTTFEEDIQWYAIPAPSGTDQGESENPEYGNMVQGIGIFRYEINSRAASANGEVRTRSTTSRVYN